MVIKHDRHFSEKFTKCAKAYGLFLLIVLFGCWLAGQANSDDVDCTTSCASHLCYFRRLRCLCGRKTTRQLSKPAMLNNLWYSLNENAIPPNPEFGLLFPLTIRCPDISFSTWILGTLFLYFVLWVVRVALPLPPPPFFLLLREFFSLIFRVSCSHVYNITLFAHHIWL